MRSLLLLLLVPMALGCAEHAGSGPGTGGAGGEGAGGAAASHSLVIPGCDPSAPASRFISCVTAFEPGDGAGVGQDRFPDVIYGPPNGIGPRKGSTDDVLSLGKLGSITVGFGSSAIGDGEGPDFIVFENAFYVNGNPDAVFKELGEVSVSEDGETWVTFPCHQTAAPYTGCAGWHAVLSNPENGISPLDVANAGGDAFDLADVGLKSARFVRIRDVSDYGGTPNAGFDLDAIAIVNVAVPAEVSPPSPRPVPR